MSSANVPFHKMLLYSPFFFWIYRIKLWRPLLGIQSHHWPLSDYSPSQISSCQVHLSVFSKISPDLSTLASLLAMLVPSCQPHHILSTARCGRNFIFPMASHVPPACLALTLLDFVSTFSFYDPFDLCWPIFLLFYCVCLYLQFLFDSNRVGLCL